MPRPPKCRRVAFIPGITYFQPAGIPLEQVEEVVLALEELEAIRLKDLEGLEQEDCAARMHVSRPTFARILNAARAKVAEALVSGKAIKVEGGCYQLVGRICCPQCGRRWEPEEDSLEFCPHCGNRGSIRGAGAPRRCRRRHGWQEGEDTS
ncbi:DUF134 domain-containing protein [Thermanaeromonas toyohensis]|uniref:DUF134 domain-containing protein n=1 Tax=Thermanaeromonas toyohensis TaxID=161154 RepID=UPI000A01B915|nr:DUF134 domain-containing protein [Thermanaeromonas toyohensis]